MDLNKLIIYELYVDKFAGDFKGLTRKLSYLSDLGVNTLLILPHYPSPMIDGGYDVSNYKAVRFELGDLEEFEECMVECEKRNIRVIVDLVLNHTSIRHPWFIDAKSSRQSQKRDWYLWGSDRSRLKESRNVFPRLKPSNWIYSEPTDSYYYATFYPQQADLNWDNPQVFEAFVDIIKFWLRRGVSGFRLDAVSHMIKREHSESVNEPEVHNIIKRLRLCLEEHNPEVILLAETSGTHKDAYSYFGNGDECHLVFNFGIAAALFPKYIMGESEMFAAYKADVVHVPEGCAWAVHLRNHDALSFNPLPIDDRTKIISMIDPHHDFEFMRGNGVSMRMGSILDSEQIIKMYADLFSLEAAKIIYYGSEIGMKNEVFYKHPRDTREYVRGDFDWELAQSQNEDPHSILSLVKARISQNK